MKKLLIISLLSTSIWGCGRSPHYKTPDTRIIETEISRGNFTEASKMIGLYTASDTISPTTKYYWDFRREVMRRINKDFSRDKDYVINYIKKYYPEVTKHEISQWEETNALENMVIDGQKRYFHSAARNLFRIDSLAAAHFQHPDQRQSDSLDIFLKWYIPELVTQAKSENKRFVSPKSFKIKYTLTVKPGEVPKGEIIRVWMPYPRKDVRSQTNIELISASHTGYIISQNSHTHESMLLEAPSSIYMEAPSNGNQPTSFEYEFQYTSYAQVCLFDPSEITDYNKNSPLYKKYTSQRAPHMLFSERIKNITDSLTKNETNPYRKIKSIYEWIDSNFPWASAREYSTIDNIPKYVLDNRHGDCGQVSLLFITMARAAGVPAKWQSGWMLHPGNKNLHDWAEVYFEGAGWVPVDQSFGRVKGNRDNQDAYYFFTRGLDQYRLIVNQEISLPFFPAKIHPRSETVDFQRGEVEWRGENLYFGRWSYNMDIEYLD